MVSALPFYPDETLGLSGLPPSFAGWRRVRPQVLSSPLSPEITVNLVATARSEPHGVRSWRLQRDLVSPLAKSVGEARQMRRSTSQRAQGRRGQLGPRIPTTSPPSNNRGEQRERGEDHLTARGPHISVTEEQVSNRREVVRPMKQTAVTEGRGWRQWPTWKR
jgi:hypothetical protein